MTGSLLAVVFRAFVMLAFVWAMPAAGATPLPAPPAATAGAFDPAAYGAKQLLVVHYHRGDGDYQAWNLWAWPEGKDGAAFRFDGSDEFGAWAVVPLQDLLHLGDEARFNTPGTSQGNWSWRLGGGLDQLRGPLQGLGELARRHQR